VEPLSEFLWKALAVAGGGFALTFIVAIALAIAAMTLLFLGSSVIVLDRFARTASRPIQILCVALVWSVLVGVVWFALAESETEGFSTHDVLAWGKAILFGAVGVLPAVGLMRVALHFLSPRALTRVGLVWIGIGYGIWIGGSGQILLTAVPFVAMCAAWALVRIFGSDPRTKRVGTTLGTFAISLLPGVALSIGLRDAPSYGIASLGTMMIAAFGGMVVLGMLPLAITGFLERRGSVEWFIAVRYLVAKRRQTFISLITFICVGGVAAGVWLIIIVLSVMNGFEQTWRDEIIGNRAHLTVHSGMGLFGNYKEILDKVSSFPEVLGATPYIDAEGMVRGDGGRVFGVRVRGIDPTRVGQVTDLASDLIAGSLDALRDDTREGADEDPAIIVGSKLAAALDLKVGDPLVLISPFGGKPTPMGPAPRLKRFRMAGVFESSFFEYDEIYTYVSLSAAQDFLRVDDVVAGIEVRVTDFYRSRVVGKEISRALGFPFFTRDWKEYYPAFFQALKTERMMMFFLLTMIMVVAAFVIVATLVMMIMEKSSDIAILKAMGAEDETIERVFAIEGVLIGLAGTALGIVAGIIVTTRLEWIQAQIEAVTGIDTLPASVYQLSTIPWHIDFRQILVVASIAMILSLGATLLPSRQGAQLDPAEALRYE